MSWIHEGPEQAVMQSIGTFGVPEPAGQAVRSPTMWVSGRSLAASPDWRIDKASVAFRKHRRSSRRHACRVSFEVQSISAGTDQGRRIAFDGLYALERAPGGEWAVIVGVEAVQATTWLPPLETNLAGGGWPEWAFAGGAVRADPKRVKYLQLRFANGVVLSDSDLADGALFITDEPVALPAVAVFVDSSGDEVAHHTAFLDPLGDTWQLRGQATRP